MVWFGLTWSLELYQQTVARLWRQGQTENTVVIQHIVTAGRNDDCKYAQIATQEDFDRF